MGQAGCISVAAWTQASAKNQPRSRYSTSTKRRETSQTAKHRQVSGKKRTTKQIQDTARKRANPPTTGGQAGKPSHKPGTSTKRHGTSQSAKHRQESGKKRTTKQIQARHGTKTSQPTNYRQASAKNQPRSRYKHETGRNEPSPKAQAGKRQEPAKKQVQARNGTKRAKRQSAGRQAPRTSHEAGTSTKRHETSRPADYRHASAKTATKQVQARSGGKPAKPQSTGR